MTRRCSDLHNMTWKPVLDEEISGAGRKMRVCIMTLGSRGDVQPYVSLGKELVRRGHSAVVCTGGSFRQFVEENGVEFKETASDLMAVAETPEGKAILEHPVRNMRLALRYSKEIINPAFRKTLDDFYSAAKGADMIVYHPKALGAVDMALSLGIPCVSMPPVPITFPVREFANLAVTHKNLGPVLNRLTYKVNEKAEAAQIKEINDFREKTLGIRKRRAGIYTYTDGTDHIPIVYPISSLLFPDVRSWDGQVFLPGFLFLETDEKLPDEITDFINAGEKPVVVSFSSMPLSDPERFMGKLSQALEKTNERVIVLTGNSGISGQNSKTGLFIKSAPHSLLFPRAKGVVHHGGVGTMAAALKAGIPQQIIPFSVDQPFWAERLYKLGYGLKPLREKTLSSDDLANAFIQMNVHEVQSKAKQISSEMQAENGNERLAEYLEGLI